MTDLQLRGNTNQENYQTLKGQAVRKFIGFYVYILASCRNGTLYVGMTDDLARRIWEHQIGAVPGFTRKYDVKMLVWFERHESRESAFQRERQLKKWSRIWKLDLIEKTNPGWRDLTEDVGP
jgi:putative endonuclease